jgi:hypothetical protein
MLTLMIAVAAAAVVAGGVYLSRQADADPWSARRKTRTQEHLLATAGSAPDPVEEPAER